MKYFVCKRSYALSLRAKVFSLLLLAATNVHASLNVLIVEGLGGDEKYQQQFDKDVQAIRAASTTLAGAEQVQVLSGEGATRANITAVLKQFATRLTKDDRLMVYLVGHGSHDGVDYKFNIPGPDLDGVELQKLLNAIKSDNQLVVATGSSSGALQEALKKDSRLVLTGTRSGNERNATHFGGLFAAALADATADTDKNGRITVQEAFDFTTRKVKDYFEAENKLVTEHAQLNGGRANVFAIAQLGGAPVAGGNAAASPEREALNSQLEELRLRKEAMSEEEYLEQLEPLLLKIAELDAQTPAQPATAAESSAAGAAP